MGMMRIEDVAARIGVSYWSVRKYHQHAQTARRNREPPKPGAFPPPDERIGDQGSHGPDEPGGIPLWKEETINEWIRHRPGQGAGGGRKKTRT